MAWIESHQELARHPKTKKLARRLNIITPAAVGYLHFLWWWAMDYAQEGWLNQYEPDDIADAMMWNGSAEELIDALVEVGFLDQTEEGLRIHDWDDYAGRLIEQKKFYAERKKRNRQLYDDVDLTRKVRARDGDNCRYCGKKVNWKDRKGTDGGTYDHVDPEGPNTENNIVVACRSCNSEKGRRTPEEAGMHLLPAGKSRVDNQPEINQKFAIPNLTKPNQTEPKEKDSIPFAEIIEYLNLKTNQSYKASSQESKRLITARWNQGFRLDDFKTVIDKKTNEWLNDPEMCQYLRPQTLFGTKFESYLNQPIASAYRVTNQQSKKPETNAERFARLRQEMGIGDDF